jgi:hypothetical protein
MTDFLDGPETQAILRQLRRSSPPAEMAVAYWGEGASAMLGLDDPLVSTKIICDLQSGRCNPREISYIRRLPMVQIKVLDGLHAKVYLFSCAAVVGSSNASSNGLTDGSSDGRYRSEANILLHDPAILQSLRTWFDRQWQLALNVTDEMCDSARRRWEIIQQSAPKLRQSHSAPNTLLSRLRSHPAFFSRFPVRVLAYSPSETSPQAREAFKAQAEGEYSAEELKSEEPFYEIDNDWSLERGELILDFTFGRRHSKPRYHGIWRVRSRPEIAVQLPDAPQNRIVLCREEATVHGLAFPREEQIAFRDFLLHYMERRDGVKWQDDDYGNYVDADLLELVTEASRLGIAL